MAALIDIFPQSVMKEISEDKNTRKEKPMTTNTKI
jgi:hypothetical protein